MNTIKLQVGKKEVELPEKLTIEQYQRLRTTDNFDKSPIDFIVGVSGLDRDEVKYANKKDMDFVFKFLTGQYLQNQTRKLQTIIEVEGVEYGLMSEMTSLNFGGWVDLEFLVADGVEKNLHKIMALLYRPITKKVKDGYEIGPYDHDEMNKRAEIFKNIPIEYFWGVSNFFFNLVKAYSTNMKASLEYQRTKEKAMTRLRMMTNPLRSLWKRLQDFTGRVLCLLQKRTSPK